ncbi:MAG: GDP-mannose 4,6-dehydratase [Kiritimatiellia bacterium]
MHLAGQAHVPTSWTKPAETIDINVVGTVNLLEAFRRVRPAARILFISTAEVYGRREGAELVPEDAPMVPESIYGISKAAGDMASRAHARHHGMAVMVARPQNHIGPGQSPIFAAASFAAQIAALLRDPAPPRRLLVGNLHSERDFTDVRDVVRAYRILLERGTPGRAYNIGSGRNRRISELLDCMCAVSGIQPKRITHEPYYRPTETPAILDTAASSPSWGGSPPFPSSRPCATSSPPPADRHVPPPPPRSPGRLRPLLRVVPNARKDGPTACTATPSSCGCAPRPWTARPTRPSCGCWQRSAICPAPGCA